MGQVEDAGQIAVEIDGVLAGLSAGREHQAVDLCAQDRRRLLAAVVGGVEHVQQVGDAAAENSVALGCNGSRRGWPGPRDDKREAPAPYLVEGI